MAASLEQGRIVFRFARELLDDDPAYKFSDSYVRSAITHIETRTSIPSLPTYVRHGARKELE